MQIQRAVEVKISQLHPNPWNPNRRTERQSQALKESLDKFGQFAEILVRPHPGKKTEYQILNGEHRYNELKEAGNESIFVNIIEVSDFDAKKITLIANDGGDEDPELLASLIQDLTDLCDGDLEELMEGMSYDFEEISELLQSGDNEDAEDVETSEDVDSKKDYSALAQEGSSQLENAQTAAVRAIQIPFPVEDFEHAYKLVKLAHSLDLEVGKVLTTALEEAVQNAKDFKELE